MNKLIYNKHKVALTKAHPDWSAEVIEAEAIKAHDAEVAAKAAPDTAEVAKEETPKKEQPKTQEEPVITLSEFNRLLKEALDKRDKEYEQKFAKTEEVEEDDDYLDIPVTFFMYVHAHSLFSYKYRGKEVFPPFSTKENPRPISFVHTFKKKSKFGDGETRIIQICSFTTRSKAEVEYVEKCPDYNIHIFRKLSDAMNMNVFLADKMADAHNVVRTMNQPQVIERCKVLGLPITTDLDQMKHNLIHRMAEDSMKADTDRHMRIAAAMATEEVARSKPAVVSSEKISSQNLEETVAAE